MVAAGDVQHFGVGDDLAERSRRAGDVIGGSDRDQIAGLDVSAEALRKAELSRLTDPGEIDLVKRLASFPRLIDGAASAHEPHRVAFYLYDLASALHSQWTRGNDSPHLRFIQSNDGVATSARLALIAATKTVIKSGLEILGVEAPDAMR